MTALASVLACGIVIAAVVWWRRAIETAAAERFDAAVERKRADDAEKATLDALDAKKAADDQRDPVALANEMIANAGRRSSR